MTQISSMAPRVAERARLRDVALPGWWRWVSQAAVVWALGYGSLRIYWVLGDAPSPPPIGSDLIVFTGWWSVVLCGAAAVVFRAQESQVVAAAGRCGLVRGDCAGCGQRAVAP